MKHFKLFLLPLLAMTLVFSSCEQQDLSLTYIEPIQDWGKSPQDILEKMTKSKSGATLEYTEGDISYLYAMQYENYGISDEVVYGFANNKLYSSTCNIYSNIYKQTIKDYFDKKFTLVEYKKYKYSEEFLYYNKKKTSSTLLIISDYDEINITYTPYIEGNIDDFYDMLGHMKNKILKL